MAGIIDIKYDREKKTWTAKPRFANPAWGWADAAPSFEARLLPNALYGLCNMLPLDMANALRMHYPRRMYNSPERELGSVDKCIDVDGHCPSQEEFNRRHFAFKRNQLVQSYNVNKQ